MQPQIPPLRYGMTNKRASNDSDNLNDNRNRNRRFLRFAME